MLSNPVYAGAYAYGKSRTEQFVDEQGIVRKRTRMLPRSQWAVLIPGLTGATSIGLRSKPTSSAWARTRDLKRTSREAR